jgi:hypothetical protein
VVTAVQETSASENDEQIYRAIFTFDRHGRRWTSESYGFEGAMPAVGAKVDVEVAGEASRILGMRRRMFSWWSSLVLLFPLAGLCIAGGALYARRHLPRLLERGDLAGGKLVAKRETSARINHQPVYELTFEFESQDRRVHRATAKSHLLDKLTDEDREPILFDPRCPSRAYVVDHIPGIRAPNHDGYLPPNVGAAFRATVLPVLTVAAAIAALVLS